MADVRNENQSGTLEVMYYRVFRDLKNGGVVDTGVRVGVTHTGTLLVPADVVGISDQQALEFAGNPARPVLVESGKVFIDIQHAIDFFPDPTSKAALEALRKRTLERARR